MAGLYHFRMSNILSEICLVTLISCLMIPSVLSKGTVGAPSKGTFGAQYSNGTEYHALSTNVDSVALSWDPRNYPVGVDFQQRARRNTGDTQSMPNGESEQYLGTPHHHLVIDSNFCPREETRETAIFNSSCTLCPLRAEFRSVACPQDSEVVEERTGGCAVQSGDVFTIEGCYAKCRPTTTTVQIWECCSGYWGPLCTVCPGGASNVCSSRGQCDDGWLGGGTCRCDANYSGIACEICIGTLCETEQVCTSSSSDCHPNATCQEDQSGFFSCQCDDGYYGNGTQCHPIDPCIGGNGGCPTSSSYCIHDGPNQYHCECKPGFESYVPGVGCSLVDCCETSPDVARCSENGRCVTIGPNVTQCQCLPGYVGNGQICYGNIIQRLEHLNAGNSSSLDGRLTEALKLFEASGVYRHLQDTQVLYTAFVPVNEAPFFADTEFARQLEAGLLPGNTSMFLTGVANLHIVPGYVDVNALNSTSHVYTSTGQELNVLQESDGFHVGIEGISDTVHILLSDLPASNGVIHIVDDVIRPPPELAHPAKGSLWDVISARDDLGILRGFIQSDHYLRRIFQFSDNLCTLMAATDEALQLLDLQFTSRLIEGGVWGEFLEFFLTHHMSSLELSAHDLMKAGTFRNEYENAFQMRVSASGQMSLGGVANLTAADVQASNGIVHIVDAILIEKSFVTLHDCSQNGTEGICFPCRIDCSGNGQCFIGEHSVGHCICDDAFGGSMCQYCRDETMSGMYCNQTCSCVHGECDSGPLGTGHCLPNTCQLGFMGGDCHLHTTPCGPTQDPCHAHTTCLVDSGVERCICSAGYEGSGLACNPINPCEQPDMDPCDPSRAECIYLGPGQHHCQCLDGYQGDGRDCIPRDRCLEDNGGCHIRATCVHHFLLDQVECSCVEGFEGNGYFCEPVNACLKGHQCDEKAQCVPTGPGTYNCTCPAGSDHYAGRCIANLAEELLLIPAADLFWEMIQAAQLDGYLAHTTLSLGVIVPPLDILRLVQTETSTPSQQQHAWPYFVRSNMFIADIADGSLNQTIPSLQPGETVSLNGPHGNLSIVNGYVSPVRRATNGFIFLPVGYSRDYWLERLQMIQDKVPFLSEPSGDVQEYTLAWQWIQSSGVLLSNRQRPFTVFLPNNEVMSSLNASLINDEEFMEYHMVIGEALYYEDLSMLLNITTMGGTSLLVLHPNRTVILNTMPIAAPDILILPHGIAHGIQGILAPHQRSCSSNGSLTEEVCHCPRGYRDDGLRCHPINPCSHDNGGCHLRAECLLLGPGERRCICGDGYEGDGVVCYGTIYQELLTLPEASYFVNVTRNLDFLFLLKQRSQFTVFVPSNEALGYFLQDQKLQGQEFEDSYRLMQYMAHHIVAGRDLSMADLQNITATGTLSGQDINVQQSQDGSIVLGDRGHILEADHLATNGIIHIIDAVITPPWIFEGQRFMDQDDDDHGYGQNIPSPNFDEGVNVISVSHNITTFIRILQRTPMFLVLFSDRPEGPGPGGRSSPGRPASGLNRGPPRRHRGPRGIPEHAHDQARLVSDLSPGSPGHVSHIRIPGSVLDQVRTKPDRTVQRDVTVGRKGKQILASKAYEGYKSSKVEDIQREYSYRPSKPRAGQKFGQSLSKQDGTVLATADEAVQNQLLKTLEKRSLGRDLPRRDFPHRLGNPSRSGPGPGRHFGQQDSTVFAPTDEAFEKLPQGTLDKLLAPENWFLLEEFIAHHVVPQELEFYNLWPEDGEATIATLQGSDLRLKIDDEGHLLVNEESRVIGVGLEFEGGVLYPVTQVISLPSLDGRCDGTREYTKMGRCKSCDTPACPVNAEQVGEIRQGCRYAVGWYDSKEGCHAECKFTEVIRECCPGYYGPACRECPGGSTMPCGGHGQCQDGFENDGRCVCKDGFTGTACERCLPGRYSPTCKECQCFEGSTCIPQTGGCFCPHDMSGRFCDAPLATLPVCTPACHPNAVCRPGNRCECSPQYHGNGYTCSAINQCFSDNGGCSLHATCTHNATSLSVNCKCHDGYRGDGVVCLPVDLCEEENGGCHPNATCRFKGPKARTCVCKPPFWGDGFHCHFPVISCLHDNGGCSPNAVCRAGQDGGSRTCACRAGFVGDGINCNNNMYETIATQPRFFHFYEMLTRFANMSRKGRRLIRNLMQDDEEFTAFIPDNPTNINFNEVFLPSQVLLHVIHDSWSREQLLEETVLETWVGDDIEVETHQDSYHQTIITIEGVEIVTFDIRTTNGFIHVLKEPLPVWHQVDYFHQSSSEEVEEANSNKQEWVTASRIFAMVAVPLGVIAFVAVAIVYWLQRTKARVQISSSNIQMPPRERIQVEAAGDVALATNSPSPSVPSSPGDAGDVQYTEFDQLMSEEDCARSARNRESTC